MKKNVIIISCVGLCYENSAAVARMSNYAKALASCEGVNVYLLSQKYYTPDAMIINLHNDTENIFTTEKRSHVNGRNALSILKFIKSVNRFRKRLEGDSVYLFYPTSNPLCELIFLLYNSIFTNVKLYCEVNEIRKYDSRLRRLSTAKRLIYNLMYSLYEVLLHFYDGVVCISRNIEKYANRYNKNSIVVPILSDVIKITNKPRISNEREVVKYVFTGSISIEKENLVELLKGFALLNECHKNWVLYLYGNITGIDRKIINQLTSEYQLDSNVHICKAIPHDEVPNVLKDADCLILPRCNNKQNFYGFSTKLSEYAVSGTPIIMTNTGVVADYFKDGYDCLMVSGYSAHDFYEKFVQFESLTVEQKCLIGENARLTAAKYFDWRKYANALNSFLK